MFQLSAFYSKASPASAAVEGQLLGVRQHAEVVPQVWGAKLRAQRCWGLLGLKA